MTEKWIKPLLGLGVIGLLVLSFFLLFERVDVDRDVGYSGPARENPILASQRLMERMGVSNHLLESFAPNGDLPPLDAAMVLLFSRKNFSQQRAAKLLDWVNDGGILYIAAQTEEDGAGDSLLEEQMIYAFLPVNESSEEEPEEEDNQSPADLVKSGLEQHLTNLTFFRNKKYKVDLGPYELGFGNPHEHDLYKDEHGVRILSLSRGRGKIVVLPTLSFMANEYIGEHDHAAFLYSLLTFGERHTKEIWFVFKDSYPTIWEFLYDRAWMAMSTFPLFILFCLWALSPRLGPIEPEPAEERRRLMEHVHATGQFLWEYQGGTSLLEETRNAFKRQLRLRKATWVRLRDEELYTNLAEHSGLDYGLVKQALTPGKSGAEEHFHETIKNLETMRRSL